jgi:amino acid transporter
MRAMGKRSVSSFLMVLLNVGWYGLAIVLALTVVLVVGANVAVQVGPDGSPSVEALGPNWTMAIPVSFSVDSQKHRITARALGVEDAHMQDVKATLKFPPRRGTFLLANLAFVICLGTLALWGLGQLRAVFRTLRDGQPFVPANARRVRQIAWACILGELARSAFVFFENYYAMTHFTADGLRFDARFDLNFFAIVNGLIILVIAEVFRAGTRLDEDQSLTV